MHELQPALNSMYMHNERDSMSKLTKEVTCLTALAISNDELAAFTLSSSCTLPSDAAAYIDACITVLR
jgi:uncharacterized protein YigA (DUF484 family)